MAQIGPPAPRGASAGDKERADTDETMKQTPFFQRLTSCVAVSLTAAMLSLVPAPQASAQNLFAPVVTINGRVVTRYEVEQRALFLQVLRAPGDLEKQALEALIDERVQGLAADAAGISISEDQLLAGMNEFAARAELDAEASWLHQYHHFLLDEYHYL